MSLSPRRARAAAVTAILIGGLALAGCAGSSGPATGGSPGASAAPTGDSGAAQVTITLTGDDGDRCVLDYASAPAGPVTFTVKNTNSTALTEVELQSRNRILGEKENLAPGLKPVSFTVRLDGGDYQIYCPGADPETQPFTVTGKAAASPTGSIASILADGAAGYADYAKGVAGDMVTAVAALKDAVDAGDLAAAKQKYALARPFYEKIESDVDGFVLPGFAADDNHGNLDYLLDMRASTPPDPEVGWHGFHAIERDLFQRGAITDDTKKLAAELVTNTGKLNDLLQTLEYKPEDLANGAAGLLEEVQSGKITGEEEAYSHIDLVDFAGNVEGAQQAFAFLRPGLDKIDAALATQVADRFRAVTTLLDTYRDPAALGGYKEWTAQLRAADSAKLSKAVQALQEPLSRIAEKVATAG
ncbi:iron uptake system protein EfeO [Microbacterium luticocti]|uniref:iron uptake system protein EfeO n=1 Tax=Microbacterium luticocti TaxID=451764 RepID=UPI000422552A|nr:iron uptake system protein EfeO [Microbacterium luticocti]